MRKLVFPALCLISFALGSLITYASLQSTTTTIHNSATLKAVGVEVYSDPALTSKVASIDWGVLGPGENRNVTTYMLNTSNVSILLSLRTENWQPANASQWINLAWNYQGQSIPVNSSISVTFTLAVSSTISGVTSFSFDIVIIGSG